MSRKSRINFWFPILCTALVSFAEMILMASFNIIFPIYGISNNVSMAGIGLIMTAQNAVSIVGDACLPFLCMRCGVLSVLIAVVASNFLSSLVTAFVHKFEYILVVRAAAGFFTTSVPVEIFQMRSFSKDQIVEMGSLIPVVIFMADVLSNAFIIVYAYLGWSAYNFGVSIICGVVLCLVVLQARLIRVPATEKSDQIRGKANDITKNTTAILWVKQKLSVVAPKAFWHLLLIECLFSVGKYGLNVSLVLIFVTHMRLSPSTIGVGFLALGIVSTCLALLRFKPRLLRRFGFLRVLSVASILLVPCQAGFVICLHFASFVGSFTCMFLAAECLSFCDMQRVILLQKTIRGREEILMGVHENLSGIVASVAPMAAAAMHTFNILAFPMLCIMTECLGFLVILKQLQSSVN